MTRLASLPRDLPATLGAAWGGCDAIPLPALRWVDRALARGGYDASLHNFGALRCACPGPHAAHAGRCRARRLGGKVVYLRAFPSDAAGLRRLVELGLAATLAAEVRPVSREGCSGMGGGAGVRVNPERPVTAQRGDGWKRLRLEPLGDLGAAPAPTIADAKAAALKAGPDRRAMALVYLRTLNPGVEDPDLAAVLDRDAPGAPKGSPLWAAVVLPGEDTPQGREPLPPALDNEDGDGSGQPAVWTYPARGGKPAYQLDARGLRLAVPHPEGAARTVGRTHTATVGGAERFAADALGLWPFGPSDELEARVQETAAAWAGIDARTAENPKLAAVVAPQRAAWATFWARWQRGDKDVDQANAAIADVNVARRNVMNADPSGKFDASGKWVTAATDKGAIKNVALENESAARGGAVAVDEAAKDAADKLAKTPAWKWAGLGAALAAVLLAALRR